MILQGREDNDENRQDDCQCCVYGFLCTVIMAAAIIIYFV